jgi:hypothetical protein
MNVENTPEIFISYAREDLAEAIQLKRDLEILGANTWLDESNMVPGIPWRGQIEEALDTCDYVILLLSNNSIKKDGFIQVEKRYILDRLDYMPVGKIFLIPARLEECTPKHRKLKEIHWVSLFPSWKEGLKKIGEAINLSANKLNEVDALPVNETKGPKSISAEDYFEVVLPTMLKWKEEEATKLNKKVVFELSDGSKKSWTVRLLPPKACVVSGAEAFVDLLIKISTASMNAILSGKFDAKKSIDAGEVVIAGDREALKLIAYLFQTVGNVKE